ncbi:MAG: hypothetical protein NTZ05_14600 [Chloroflexi bacterium]|nr:hypothetical protein [Chloroflexota bacterium]
MSRHAYPHDTAPGRSIAARAIISGFIATGAMTATLLLAYTLMANLALVLPRSPLREAFAALTHNTVVELTTGSLPLAIIVHLVIGVTFGLVYAYWAEPRLPGAGWQRGLLFALFPFLVSVIVVLTALGGGPLGLNIGAGPLPVLGNLVLHIVYGVTLGAVYALLGSRADWLGQEGAPSRREAQSEAGYERGSAIGLVLGAAIGGGLGVAFGAGLDTMTPAMPDLDPWTYGLAGGVLGAAGGMLAGSFAGMTPPQTTERGERARRRRAAIPRRAARGRAAHLRVRRRRAAAAGASPAA